MKKFAIHVKNHYTSLKVHLTMWKKHCISLEVHMTMYHLRTRVNFRVIAFLRISSILLCNFLSHKISGIRACYAKIPLIFTPKIQHFTRFYLRLQIRLISQPCHASSLPNPTASVKLSTSFSVLFLAVSSNTIVALLFSSVFALFSGLSVSVTSMFS